MYQCLTSSKYSMQADLYRQVRSTDDSGQIIRSWEKLDTFNCYIYAVESTGAAFSARERFGSTWSYDIYARMSTSKKLALGDRVTSVRDSLGTALWTDIDDKDIVFNVTGVAPKTTPFGSLLEFDVMLNRAEDSVA